MKFDLQKYSTEKYRWWALIFIALGLAIVIIDNTVLNVSIPYMLRDLHTNLDSIEWVISGYSLVIATVLITVGRIGDLWGRKKLFITGIVIFVIGSFIGSIAQDVTTIIIGRGVVQAVGAAMTLTSALSLVTTEFRGHERAIAFGIWGSVAGAAASVGPLLGGYLTTYYSWRWSLRINVVVGMIALLGSIFIKESKGEGERHFDWLGTVLSGLGIFSLIFAFIEGQRYGWFKPTSRTFSVFGVNWPFNNVSIIPFMFGAAILFILLFISRENYLESGGRSPLLRLSVFKNIGFSLGLLLLAVLTFGQFGTFFVLPIYLENVLGMNAFEAGLVFLATSGTIFVVGSLTGWIASKINIKWIVSSGLLILTVGIIYLSRSLSVGATQLSLTPALIVFGLGFGLGGSQLNNIILSSASQRIAGEASAVSVTMRQLGGSIGVALIGVFYALSLTSNIKTNIQGDYNIPPKIKQVISSNAGKIDVEGGQVKPMGTMKLPPAVDKAVTSDINKALVSASKEAMNIGSYFIAGSFLISLFIPKLEEKSERAPMAE